MGAECSTLCKQKIQQPYNNSSDGVYQKGRSLYPTTQVQQQHPTKRSLQNHQFVASERQLNQSSASHGPNLNQGQFVELPVISLQVSRTIASLSPLTQVTNNRGREFPAKPFRETKRNIIYDCEWRNSQPHGIGKTYYPDGSLFEGEFMNGVPVGHGRFINSNGSYYEGEIKAGAANGQGKYVSPDFQYLGGFRENKQHGDGTEERKGENAYTFTGLYERGNKVRGTLTWDNGKYIGEFEKGQFTGKGVLTVSDGTYTGDFLDGKYHGQGEYCWNDGAKYQGGYEFGMKQGYGRYYSAGNLYVYEGHWKQGNQHGGGKATVKGVELRGKWEQGHVVQQF